MFNNHSNYEVCIQLNFDWLLIWGSLIAVAIVADAIGAFSLAVITYLFLY